MIREIFEFGKKRIAQVGAEKVFDFSLGNPNVPAPQAVEDTILELLRTMDPAQLHGYTSAQGDAGVREQIAAALNKAHGTHYTGDNLYMTVGAAASLCICFKALAVEGEISRADASLAVAEQFGWTETPFTDIDGCTDAQKEALEQARSAGKGR